MPVLKTASPNVSPSAPKASPWKVRPSSRTRIAGRGRRGPEGAGLSGDAGACRGTPYLLLRLTGRIVKGCRARQTLPVAPPPPRTRDASPRCDERHDLRDCPLVGLEVGQVGDTRQVDQPRRRDLRGEVRGVAVGVGQVVLTDEDE